MVVSWMLVCGELVHVHAPDWFPAHTPLEEASDASIGA